MSESDEPSPAEQARAQEREDLEAVLSTPAGRRFVWALVNRAGVFGHSFSLESNEMAFSEGRRAVGIELMVRVQTDAPRRWFEVLTEAAART